MLKVARIVACLGLVLSTVGPALAQTAQEILQAASEKLIENARLRGSMTIHGEGSDMFRSILPKGEAKVLLRRVEVEGTAHWEARVTGTSTTGNPKEPDPIGVDFVENDQTQRWIDHQQKKVFDMVPARAQGSRSTAYSPSRMLVPIELMQPQPFKSEFEAEELAVLPVVEVNGVACDVVEVSYPKPEGNPRASNGRPQQIKVFIGQDDHLVRRIERISGADLFKMAVVLEFNGWEPDANLGDKDFELPVPEGYELSEAKPVVVRPTKVRAVEGVTRPVEPQERPPEQGEVFEPAPDFAFALATGEQVTLESLRGTTAVLYFWGTWCLECRDYNPQVSKLAAEAEGQSLRVFGLAVRERDPASAKDLANLRDYRFEVAPDAASTAEVFRTVYYPTFVVIDPGGGLVGTEHVRRGVSIDAVMGRVKELIAKASPKVDLTPQPEPNYPEEEDVP